MLEGIQRKKIALLFLVFDLDENGYIERQDFERAAKTLADLNHISQFTEDYRKLRDAFLTIYDSLKEMMDENKNHRIEMDEWMNYFTKILEDTDKYADLVAPIARYIFNMLDHNENGKISILEWRRFAKAFNIPNDDMDDLFHKLDTNESGFITRDEFGFMVTDFFLSDDESKPGNYIFGRF